MIDIKPIIGKLLSSKLDSFSIANFGAISVKQSSFLNLVIQRGSAHRNLIYIECSSRVSSHFGC
jgi:hypothetical protein